MEVPLTIWQFSQLLAVLGAPVHVSFALSATWLLRSRRRLSWGVLLALAPIWLTASVALQGAMWAVLPDLPEPMFMLLGFVNGPALVGAVLLLCLLLALVPRRQPSALA